MNKRRFGRTDLLLSELSLNPDNFVSVIDATSAFAALDTYYAAGGRFFQTSSGGGNAAAELLGGSASEDLVGRWIEARRIDRGSLTLASRIKLPRPALGGSMAYVNLIRESCDRSLSRLRAKHLDLLICEWEGHLAPMDDLLEAVDMLIRVGRVRYAVAGSFPSWRVVDSLHRSRLHNLARFEGVQTNYSLAGCPRIASETFSMSGEHRLGFLANAPLAGGFLAQRPVSLREVINVDRSPHDMGFCDNAGRPILKALAEIADRRDATSAQIALAWVLQNRQVTTAVISPSGVSELTELIRATGIVFSGQEMATLAGVTNTQFPQFAPYQL